MSSFLSPQPAESASSRINGDKSAVAGGIVKKNQNIRRSQRFGWLGSWKICFLSLVFSRICCSNSPSKCELLALYDGFANSNKPHLAASNVRSHQRPACRDRQSQSPCGENSPVLSINYAEEGYVTPDADSLGMSESPEIHDACSEMEYGLIDKTPRAPSIRPIQAPLQNFEFDCRIDMVNLSKSKLDHTFSHLKLCFNPDCDTTETAVLPANQQSTVSPSLQTTPKKGAANKCLVQ